MDVSTPAAVIPGCEALSHRAGARIGVVMVHGFTGSPVSMRRIADEVIAAGLDCEVPRLAGHGTAIDEMLSTRWDDWANDVAAARAAIADRCEMVVLVGQSMGATLVLEAALTAPDGLCGLVCINPVTRLRSVDELAMIDELIADGITVAPGTGSDLADPEGIDVSYPGTPLAPLRSMFHDGIAPIESRYAEATAPLRLFTSRQDHVVPPSDSEYLAAHYSGAVEHTWLERSFHVATCDYDRDLIASETVAFATRVGA